MIEGLMTVPLDMAAGVDLAKKGWAGLAVIALAVAFLLFGGRSE